MAKLLLGKQMKNIYFYKKNKDLYINNIKKKIQLVFQSM